jgi:Chromo (CHRromatin Organisation MOdifier) domain
MVLVSNRIQEAPHKKEDCVKDSAGGNDDDDDDENLPSVADILSEMKQRKAMAKADLSPQHMITEQLVHNVTDRSLLPPNKHTDGNTGKLTVKSSPFTSLGFQGEENPLSAFAGTVQNFGPPSAVVPEDDQYFVEWLLERLVRRLGGRNRRKVIQYLVKWEGYGNEHDSWVNETNIHEDLIKTYATSTVST